MAGQIASLYAKIGADTSGLKAGLSSAQGDLKKFGSEAAGAGSQASASLGAITGIIGKVSVALGVATAAIAAAKQVYDFGAEGAQIQRLQQAGENLARSTGESYGSIVQAIKQASLGMVAESDIMLAANRAMMLGVGQSASQMADLMQVAAFRARAMGITTSQAFNDIVTGIGRMSPMILDNLGIVINAEQRFGEYAKSIGTTADKLDDATKKQIMLNSVIAEGKGQIKDAGGLTLDAAGKIERMNAAWKDLGDTWKTMIAPVSADIAQWLTSIIDPSAKVAQNLERTTGALQQLPYLKNMAGTYYTAPTPNGLPSMATIGSVVVDFDKLTQSATALASAYTGVYEAQLKYYQNDEDNLRTRALMLARMKDYSKTLADIQKYSQPIPNPFADWRNINLGIADQVYNEMMQVRQYAANGGLIQQVGQEIGAQLTSNMITPTEAEAMFSVLYIQALQMDQQLGKIDWSEFQRNVRDKFGKSADEVLKKAGEILGLNGQVVDITVLMHLLYGWQQMGGSPNLSGPWNNYNPTPGSGTRNSPNPGEYYPWNNPDSGGGGTPGSRGYVDRSTTIVNNYDQGTAALTLAVVGQQRRARLNGAMPSWIT